MGDKCRDFASFRLSEGNTLVRVAEPRAAGLTMLSGVERSHRAIRSEITILNGSSSASPALFVPAAD